MVQTLCDLGVEITSDIKTLCALLQRFGITENSPPIDAQVIEIMSSLSRMAAEGTPLCDAAALVRALCSFVRVVKTYIHLTQAPDTTFRMFQ